MGDNVSFSDDSIKIRITADGERTISISCNEELSRFEIDAPESGLYIRGENIPTKRRVAELLNVASYNGMPVSGAADGDTLGGKGRGKIREVTVFRDADKTEVWEGMRAQISGNLITVYVPHDAKDKDIKALSLSVLVDGGEFDSSEPFDLTSSRLIDVTDPSGETRTYRISAERERLGIPILEIYTEDGSSITSKEVYKTAVMRLDGKEYSLRIKGRGNSSWTMFPKKSYRIKLDSKAELCGMTADKDWCLISNYVDPSLIRNKVASDMGKVMKALPFTPGYEFVDLFVNGRYLGVYMLSENIENDEDRVDLGGGRVTGENGEILDMSFLIEIGWNFWSDNIYGKDFFDSEYALRMYIKEPEVSYAYNNEFMYVHDYIMAAERAIVKGEGYEEYIDVDSWVDWFIVTEFTNNTECAGFYRSLYMYKPLGGKLTAGPIWDSDMAFGNFTEDIYGYDGWASVDFTYYDLSDNWMKFLTKDEKFMSRVRERWEEMKEDLLETALSSVDNCASQIRASQKYNFLMWPEVLKTQIGMSRASILGFKDWEQHIDYIKEFIQMRYDWIDKKLNTN